MQRSIVLGGGCFWCIEAVYTQTRGVLSATSGYANGDIPNPTYKDVCSGITNHAEVVKVVYDDEKIALAQILKIFWNIHNPTSLNKQGADIGTQYRSAIFYDNESDESIAIESKNTAQEQFEDQIVTQIEPLDMFYCAEEYHQNYYARNPSQGYCMAVIAPKINKFLESFKELKR